jgi:hypothetical protein
MGLSPRVDRRRSSHDKGFRLVGAEFQGISVSMRKKDGTLWKTSSPSAIRTGLGMLSYLQLKQHLKYAQRSVQKAEVT